MNNQEYILCFARISVFILCLFLFFYFWFIFFFSFFFKSEFLSF